MDKITNIKGIGMRNIKTAISAFICMLILSIFKDYSPFFACIAAVITLQNSIDSTIKTGINRMIGTIIGALIGLIYVYINPNSIILSSIGIIFVIYLANLLKRSGSTAIACIVYLAIVLNIKDASPMLYSLFRVLETLLGIMVATIVNISIAPPDKKNLNM